MPTNNAAVVNQAEISKQNGNLYFKKDRLGAAIDAYTEAITLCPTIPVYWTNRALCHLKRNDWIRVEEDCTRAILLDNNSVKGHYMMGLALLQRKEYAKGVKQLERALDLGRGANPKSYMVEEIWQELAKAKYLEWEQASNDRTWKLQTLKEECEKALEVQYLIDSTSQSGITEKNLSVYKDQLEALGDVFKKAKENDVPSEVPDYLCCKITLDIFRDPVITPSGVTYERAVLLDHLHKVGNFDPITRERLEEHQLAPNLAIKEAVQAFLRDHGWAYKLD
ncbi:RING-type E3 ubiquitin transferase [Ranunculus cassubicifolius]